MNEFNPDWRSAPSETIFDILEEKNMDIREFIRLMDEPEDNIFWLFLGVREINQELAEKLSRILGASPEFWLERDRQWRL